MERLRRRADFLAAAKGRRVERQAFVLQAANRPSGPAAEEPGGPERGAPRFGFTVTRRIGNAVVRNRVRRRLREAARLAAPGNAVPGTDYVVIARPAALGMPFDRLVADLVEGLRRAAEPRHQARARAREQAKHAEAG